MKKDFILGFDEIGIKDIPLVGGKNASLGEMRRLGLPVPNGFAITAYAYRYFLEKAALVEKLKKALKGLKVNDTKALQKAGQKARSLILKAELPTELAEAIVKAYKPGAVAVRSSATAEDLPEASFAGQQESFLNVRGPKALLTACKKCYASLFTNRAIAYRAKNHFDHFDVALSIGVQAMVRSTAAGVMFTLDTESGFRDVVFITGSFGYGEAVVQGAVNPDEFYVFKPTMALIDKRLGAAKKFCLSDKEAVKLAEWALLAEKHYKKPMDLEWAKEDKLYIVQARPETVQSQKSAILEEYKLLQKGKVLVTGRSVGNKIASGTAHVIKHVKDINKFKEGEILVTEMTDPDWVPIMSKAAAIITDRGGRTSHAAIVSRELGLPCLVGTNRATKTIKNGQKVTVNCASGEEGQALEGLLKFTIHTVDVKKFPPLKTKVMLNVSNPDEAFALSLLPSDGVGLAREEFIISQFIRIHPMALVNFAAVKDKTARRQIAELTASYPNKKAYFVEKLAFGIARIAAAFYPRPVIFRFSDFKTNEYSNLIGGTAFEPHEENPMIGWRGASRYYSKGYEEGFALECQAIKRVREEFGLVNLKVMIPVCRTVEEGKKVRQTMKKHGLKNIEVYVMCELPSNALLADQFCALFDGFSIGSNDLTQMTLGVDRDSALVQQLFDERDPAVKRLIKLAITLAKERGRPIGICGDAPSTYPEFAKFLVDCGIDSISLSADALLRTRLLLAKYESSSHAKEPERT